MPRSVADATRFTATTPHVYAKTCTSRASLALPRSTISPATSLSASHNARVSSIKYDPTISKASKSNTSKLQFLQHTHNFHIDSPLRVASSTKTEIPKTETPKQKVARLRAARLQARAAELTLWERTVLRGRVWADRAHRITAASLIGLTVVCAGVTAFALSDMIMHNRQKRTAFYNEQHLMYSQRLLEAIETSKAGLPLTSDQQLIIDRERAKLQADDEKNRNSLYNQTKSLFVGDLSSEVQPTGSADLARTPAVNHFEQGSIPTEAEILDRIGVDKLKMLEKATGKSIPPGNNGSSLGSSSTGSTASTNSQIGLASSSEGRHLGYLDSLGAKAGQRAWDSTEWLRW